MVMSGEQPECLPQQGGDPEPLDGAVRLWPGCDAFVPQLAFADRLDLCVDELAEWLEDQPGEQARETFLDLLVGLCTGAEAMRALARGDMTDCVDHMESAVRHLELVRSLDIVIPEARAAD
jgi:hypothetical protein